jgi:hypothetical protein
MPKRKKNSRERYTPGVVLMNWRRVVRRIPKMTAEELEAALEAEKTGEQRADVIFRIARRLNKLRGAKAMEEMLT